MKSVAILLAVFVASHAIQHLPTERRVSYDYKGYTLSGIPLVSNERTGLAIWSKLNMEFKKVQHMSQKVVLELETPVIRHVDMDVASEVLDVASVPELKEIISNEMFKQLPEEIERTIISHLRQPLVFTLDLTRMTVSDVMTLETEPEWILNIKKAIIMHFVMPIFETRLTRVEETVLGDCEVNYDSTKNLHGDSIVTKEFSLANCVSPVNFTDLVGSKMTPIENHGFTRASVFTRAITMLKNQKFIVKKLISEGRYIIAPFTPEDGEIMTYTRQEFRLVDEDTKTVNLMNVDLVKRTDSLLPVFTTEHSTMTDIYFDVLTEDEKLTMIGNLLKTFFGQIESTTKPTFDIESTHDFMHATKLMRSLRDIRSFHAILGLVDTAEFKPTRSMVINALAFCGSPTLVEALPTLKDLLTTSELNMIVTKLPMTLVSSRTTIRTLKTMYPTIKDEFVARQILLTIGSLVHDFCKTHLEGEVIPKDICTESFRKDIVEFYVEEYLRTSEVNKLIVIKSIGNSGLDMTRFLSQIILSTESHLELRVNAIYALTRMEDLPRITAILLPVYRNEKDLYPVEMRIAAFQVLMEKIPTGDMMTTLVGQLNEETDLQLGNYVYHFLKNIIDMPTFYTPTIELTVTAQTLLPTVRRFEDGLWYSKNFQYVIASVARRMGLMLRGSAVNNHEQALPTNGYFNIAQAVSGYYINLLETGFRIEGLDTMVRDFMMTWTEQMMTSGNSEEVMSGRFRREMDTLQTLLTDGFETKNYEETRGYIFFKHLGNEIGVFTLNELKDMDLKETLKETLLTWESTVRYFNVLPFIHATFKIQTPFGVPMVNDWSSLAIFSLHSQLKTPETDNTIIHRDITPRFMVRVLGRVGVDIGLYKTTLGQCMHLRTVTPFTVTVAKTEDTMEIEMTINTEANLYEAELKQNLRLLDIESTPCKHVEIMDLKKYTIKTTMEKVTLSPLLLNNEVEYEFGDLRVTLAKRTDVWTNRMFLFPYSGHASIKVDFIDRPVPVGFTLKLNKDFTEEVKMVAMKFVLNPRITEMKREFDLTMKLNLDEDKTTPLFALEVTPYNRETFKLFFNIELVKGTIKNRWFNYLEAAEDDTVEVLTKVQYGMDITHDVHKHDIVIKTTLKKSDLQKYFELVQLDLPSTPCARCERDIISGVFSTLDCVKCIPTRALLTAVDSEIYIDIEKVDTILSYYMPKMTSFWLPQLMSTLQTTRPLPGTIRQHMSHVQSSDVFSFRLINDIHPLFTTHNVTVMLGEDIELTFTDLPLIPAFRRLYNVPEARLTDTVLERFDWSTTGQCRIDSRNFVKTFDDVIFNVTKRVECEQLLVKDITTENKFEVTTKFTNDKRRIVKVVLPENLIEIEETSTAEKFIVRINKLVKTWTVAKDNVKVIDTRALLLRLTPVTTPFGVDTRFTMEVKTTKMTVTLVNKFVDIKIPYWHKSGVVGLCGDFNGETRHEMVLPDQTIASTLAHFVRAYTAPTCRTH